jgi:hypothetical protein
MQSFLQTIGVSPWMGWHAVQKGLWEWLISSAPPWMLSAAAHMLLFLILALIPIHVASRQAGDSAEFDAIDRDDSPAGEITRFEVGDAPLDPTELNTETLMQFEPEPIAQTPQYNDDSPIFEESGGGVTTGTETGGGLGFDITASGLGPILSGGGGVDAGLGMGQSAGRGGAGSGFGLRGTGNREGIPGVTKASERAVGAALSWLARHQNKDGGWTMNLGNGSQCTDRTCNLGSPTQADAGATAMAVLPFLGAGQTHMTKGPYQKTVLRGLQWLVKHQAADGDLSNGHHQMYSHGLATIALCEAYGMTQDSWVRDPAQSAIRFIESAQNAQGGWRYNHGSYEGDTSVFGWQIMALKSAKMAGLDVNQVKFDRCKMWLKQVSSGHYNGKFAYMPGHGFKESMTAVGLLGMQYTGTRKNDPAVREAVEELMRNMPSLEQPDMYYWYYATLALHNVPGEEWETWNRQMRKLLIETQAKGRCAEGSWSPVDDAWGAHGGRLMMTSLAALTLEVYYRYLPMYQLDEAGKPAAAEKTDSEEKKDSEEKQLKGTNA